MPNVSSFELPDLQIIKRGTKNFIVFTKYSEKEAALMWGGIFIYNEWVEVGRLGTWQWVELNIIGRNASNITAEILSVMLQNFLVDSVKMVEARGISRFAVLVKKYFVRLVLYILSEFGVHTPFPMIFYCFEQN